MEHLLNSRDVILCTLVSHSSILSVHFQTLNDIEVCSRVFLDAAFIQQMLSEH